MIAPKDIPHPIATPASSTEGLTKMNADWESENVFRWSSGGCLSQSSAKRSTEMSNFQKIVGIQCLISVKAYLSQSLCRYGYDWVFRTPLHSASNVAFSLAIALAASSWERRRLDRCSGFRQGKSLPIAWFDQDFLTYKSIEESTKIAKTRIPILFCNINKTRSDIFWVDTTCSGED